MNKKFKTSNKQKDKDNNSNLCNNDNYTVNNDLNVDKKITIRDLCPEEKQKIGELLKKLAEEKEEKEKLMKVIDDDKKVYESKIDSILKEKEHLNSSLSASQFNMNMNNSLCLKNESFMNESLYVQNCEKIEIKSHEGKKHKISQVENNSIDSDYICKAPQVELKNLKEKFDKLLSTLKKTAQNHDEYFIKYSNSIENENINLINTSSSLLREEKPLILNHRPTPVDCNFEENILQTSILNINDEIRHNDNHTINTSIGNNFFSESKK